mmetsp:Transcript_25477/g.83866  ORF Transcript_25477/g.83866 Transcript_25477/m.83866 type:complete len:240 (+) Transcript_25477:2033-2752(+)
MPYLVTIARASWVAIFRSEDAPVVTSPSPKMSSSATRPPMHTSSLARSCLRETLVSSFSGSCVTMPSAIPRGTMVALWTGCAPSVWSATSAWPPSWYAVSFRFSSVMTADLRSAPIMMRSLAYSKCACATSLAPSIAALSAATLTRLASSAPLKPGVPRAITLRSTPGASVTRLLCCVRICARPATSGLGTTTVRSKRPGRMSALSSDSGKLVAAMQMIPSFSLKPSSSTSIWLSVIFM